MPKQEIVLPSKLTKNSWFYEKHKEQLEPFLGRYYISYSSSESWSDYTEDFIKEKFAKLKTPKKTYALLGNYVGEAVELGEFSKDNPEGFTGQENVDLDTIRPEGAEYEKLIVIDMGDYFILGFIDIYWEEEGKAFIQDLKSGGKKKEDKYSSYKYTQVILYAHAIELSGKEIGETSVYFVRRTGSHINPPLHLSEEQFLIPLEYNQERVDYALNKIDTAAREISECYKTYLKIFK